MRKAGQISIFLFSIFSISTVSGWAQTTHNLEIVFRYTWPDTHNADEKFGISISSAGDVNGDSIDDIIVGSPPRFWVGAQDTSPGRAYVFFGGSSIDTIPDVVLAGEDPLDLFGQAVSNGGDLNGDGYGDVIVGAPNADVYYGKVYIYFGGSAMDTIPDLILWGRPTGADIGDALSYAGDVNGDGWDDIVTGGPQAFGLSGQVLIYFGGPGLDTVPDVTLLGQNSEGLGMSVGGGGDVNSDGFDDIVVGAWDNDEAYPNAGKIYVYLGGDPMDTTPDVWMHGEGAQQNLGWDNVSIANAPNYDWVITGTAYWPNGFMAYNSGKVYLLFGGSPMDSIPDVWMTGRTDSSALGQWSCGAGDVNADVYDELIAGAPIERGQEGAAYLWLCYSSMDTVPDAWLSGRWERDLIAWRLSSAGDIDGDGRDDIVISNPPADSFRTVWVCRYTGTGIEEMPDARCQKQD